MFTTSMVIYYVSSLVYIEFYMAVNVRNYSWPLGGAADVSIIST